MVIKDIATVIISHDLDLLVIRMSRNAKTALSLCKKKEAAKNHKTNILNGKPAYMFVLWFIKNRSHGNCMQEKDILFF